MPGSRSDRHAILLVEGDGVSGARRGAADERAVGAEDRNAVRLIGQRRAPGRVNPDVVALDEVVRSPAAQSDAGPVVPGQDVARGRGGAADRVARSVVEPDTVFAVSHRTSPAGVRTDVVALDQVVAGAVDMDTVDVVAGDHVAVARCGATDQIAIRHDPDPPLGIAEVGIAPRIEAEVVALDDVAAGVVDGDPGAVEAVDHQAAHGAVARAQRQPVHPGTSQGPVELDHRGAGEVRVGGPVDDHRIAYGRQSGQDVDRVRPRPGDVEMDLVGPACVRAVVGGRDRLAQGDEAIRAAIHQQRIDRRRIAVFEVADGIDHDEVIGDRIDRHIEASQGRVHPVRYAQRDRHRAAVGIGRWSHDEGAVRPAAAQHEGGTGDTQRIARAGRHDQRPSGGLGIADGEADHPAAAFGESLVEHGADRGCLVEFVTLTRKVLSTNRPPASVERTVTW